jgi:DNA-binding helix-hairpin-helix protein with protein kinase domain
VRYRLSDGSSLTLMEQIGSGREGAVYAVAGERRWLAKIYNPGNGGTEREAKLRRMLAAPPLDVGRVSGHVSIAWPEMLVLDQHDVVAGFVMPAVTQSRVLSLLSNPADRQRQAPGLTWKYLLATALNVASVVARLHASGYVVGDMSGQNFLVSNQSLITLIDCDSIQVPRETRGAFLCGVATPDFTPPELFGVDLERVARETSADSFGMAVLFFQLLMEGIHPFQGRWLGSGDVADAASLIRAGAYGHNPASRVMSPPPLSLPISFLPGPLVTLFHKAFVDGHRDPAARPTAAQWARSFTDASAALRVCGVNALHVYPSHNASCPWCERAARLGEDLWSKPPVERPSPSYVAPRATETTTSPSPTAARPAGFFARLGAWLTGRRSNQPVAAPSPTPTGTPTRPQPFPSNRPTPPRIPTATKMFVGNQFTLKYHVSSCTWAQKISTRNRVMVSGQDVLRRGMTPCGVCHPR